MWLAKPSAESHCAKRSRLGSGWRPPDAGLSGSGAVPLGGARSKLKSNTISGAPLAIRDCSSPALISVVQVVMGVGERQGRGGGGGGGGRGPLCQMVAAGGGGGEGRGGGGGGGGGGRRPLCQMVPAGGGHAPENRSAQAVIARRPAPELWSGWGRHAGQNAAGDGGFQRSMLFRRRARGGPLPQNGRHDAAAHDQGHADPADRR